MKPRPVFTINTMTTERSNTVKIPFIVGPTDRPSESSLKDAIDASDERLGQRSEFIYSPNDTGEVVMNDLKKGNLLDIVSAPDDGFKVRDDR
jgi:hypothetical protein